MTNLFVSVLRVRGEGPRLTRGFVLGCVVGVVVCGVVGFDITPIDSGSCTVQVDVRAQPRGWTRILEPVMRRAMPKQGDRITSAMAEVIENTPART